MKQFKKYITESEIYKTLTVYHIIIILTTLALLVLFTAPQFSILKLPKLNSIAQKDFIATKDYKFTDIEERKIRIQEKIDQIIPLFELDSTRQYDEDYFKVLYNDIDKNNLKKLFSFIISNGFYPKNKPYTNTKVISLIIKKQIEDNIIKNQIFVPIEDIKIIFGKENLQSIVMEFFKNQNQKINSEEFQYICEYFIKNPNISFDETSFNKEKDMIIETTPPFIKRIKKGDIIIKKGEVITQNKIELLKKYHYHDWKINLKVAIGVTFIFGFCLLFYYAFAYLFYIDVFNNINKFILVSVLIIIPVALLKIFIFYMTGSEAINKIYNIIFIIPFPAFAILTAVVVSVRFSIIQNFIVSVFLSFVYTLSLNSFSEIFNYFNFLFFLVAFISASIGVISYINIRNRFHFIRSGIIIGLSGALVILFFDFATSNIKSNYPDITALAYISMLLNGFLLSPIFTIGLLPFFETIFKITTDYKLIELSDLNLPIFKDMLVKTPGTYQHSIVVGNLSENAAELIGINPLLVRAGAYYHDIGKMNKPEYFIENQTFPEENVHSKIKPILSSSIIKSHIKIGLEIANTLKLPQEIKDIIQQHHGTSLIKIFYLQALEEAGENDIILEEDFRYPGPKPQTKEAAIVTLADVVEASCRALQNPTLNRIEETIHSVITNKIIEGELDESNLTLREIKIIEKTFYKIITTLYHSRIKYPTDSEIKEKEMERQKSSG